MNSALLDNGGGEASPTGASNRQHWKDTTAIPPKVEADGAGHQSARRIRARFACHQERIQNLYYRVGGAKDLRSDFLVSSRLRNQALWFGLNLREREPRSN